MRTRRHDYTTATQPSTSLSGTKIIHSCNAKGKGSKKKNKNKCITTTGLWDLHIPTEMLEEILSRLGLKDNIQASAVCKAWCESAVSVRKLPCRPWLLQPRDDWTLTGTPYLLLDHQSHQKHNFNFPDMSVMPGEMPWRPGDATWTTHRFENSLLRRWDKCVFSNGVFYFLSTCGCLGVFDPCQVTWNLLPVKPLLFPEVDSPAFIMEHEGDIFVMCSRLNSNHTVFKLNMKQNVWEEKRDLGGLTVFAGVTGSFIRACLSAEEMNRICPIYGKSSYRPTKTILSCRVAWVEPPQNILDLLL